MLDNPERLLLANMTATARIVLEERENVLLLSQGALIREGRSRFALVWDPQTGHTNRRRVEVGLSDAGVVEIRSGLEAGEKVLVP